MMRKIFFTFCAVIFTASVFAQAYVERVLILNEGYFDYVTNEIITPVSVGAYNPTTDTYTVIDEIENARFASDIKMDGDNYYVAADKYLNKYATATDELIASIEIEGIRKVAVNNDYIVVTRGEYLVTLPSYIQIYDKSTMALLDEFDNVTLPYTTEGVVIKDNKAYVAVNNGFVFGSEVGKIAIVDLATTTIENTIELGADGINPDNLMIDGDVIYTLNNKDFTGSSVSTYKIASADLTTTNLINISAGCGTSAVMDGTIYYQEMFGTTLSKFDPSTATIIGEDEFGTSFYGLAFDEINNLIYTGTTDYFSYGEVTVYDLLGNIVTSFETSVSPGNFAFDVRLATGVEDIKSATMELYPNPAVNQIVVVNTINATNMVITDMTGKTVFTVQQPAAGAQQIDITNLPAGNYIIKAIGQSQYEAAYFSKL
ncbi:MAG TPA: T9SS type A sorting domain-containing protein [Chitinophagales bacterium]|nr:T9SS type A sorting domain-containing protein [Chitinophagales bacterium]